MYYPLPELTLPEAKAIIERGLGAAATADVIAQIVTVTGGIHRSVDMILPRILELMSRNRRKLESGEVTIPQIITVAGTRVMAGVW